MKINGYAAVFHPENPGCFKCKKHKGWMYEHRYVAEQKIGRQLKADEEVHHIDHNRMNNSPENLVVLASSKHRKLHGVEHIKMRKRCKVCGEILSSNRRSICRRCRIKIADSKYPDNEVLQKELMQFSLSELGRRYGVSGNAIRKRARIRNLVIPQSKNCPKEFLSSGV